MVWQAAGLRTVAEASSIEYDVEKGAMKTSDAFTVSGCRASGSTVLRTTSSLTKPIDGRI